MSKLDMRIQLALEPCYEVAIFTRIPLSFGLNLFDRLIRGRFIGSNDLDIIIFINFLGRFVNGLDMKIQLGLEPALEVAVLAGVLLPLNVVVFNVALEGAQVGSLVVAVHAHVARRVLVAPPHVAVGAYGGHP